MIRWVAGVACLLVLGQDSPPIYAKGGRFQTKEGYFLRVVGTVRGKWQAGYSTFRGQTWVGPDGKALKGAGETLQDFDHSEGQAVGLWLRSAVVGDSPESDAARKAFLIPSGSAAPAGPAEFYSAFEPAALESWSASVLPSGVKSADAWVFLALKDRPWKAAGSAKLDLTRAGLSTYSREGLFPPEPFQLLLVEWPFIGVEYYRSNGEFVRVPLARRARSFDPLPANNPVTDEKLPLLDPGKVAGRWIAKLKDGREFPIESYMESEVRDKNQSLVRRGVPVPFKAMKDDSGLTNMDLSEGTPIERPEDLAEIRFETQPWQRIVFRDLPLK
jgi:hypothetical protein